MSIAVEVIDAPIVPKPVSRFAWLRRNSWALADQVLISGANFLTMVLAARAMSHAEFGAFAIIWGVLFFTTILQSTLITQAHNVLGVTLRGRAYRRYTSSTCFMQLGLIAAEALLVVPVWLWALAHAWPGTMMIAALIPTIIFWQLMEFVRRVLYTEGRLAGAFANDMISYGGQTALLIALYVAHRHGLMHFTGARALYVLSGAAALAAAVGAWQLKKSIVPKFDVRHVKENWHFGKWLAGGELMGWCSSLHMQIWWAAWLIGIEASADLRAAQILFGPMRVITFFLGTVLPIRFARTLADSGRDALGHKIKDVFLLLIPTVGVYCLSLIVFPGVLLHLVYGASYAVGESVTVLKLYSFYAFLSYLQMVIVAALTASRRTRAVFAGSVWGCMIALVMSPVCIIYFGSRGAIISMIVTTLVVAVLYAITCYRSLHPDRNRGLSPAQQDAEAKT